MRIAFLAWEYPPVLVGGLGTYAENITRKFVELGHDVTVFSLNNGGLPTREVIKGVEVHRPLITNASSIFPLLSKDLENWGINIKFFNDFFIYNILSASKLINDLIRKQSYSYDIVCFHDWLNSIAGIIIKNELKIPSVFHVHSTEWGRSGDGSEIIKALERKAANEADSIITVSYAMKEDLTRHGWPEGKINVVWNGVDPEKYNPEKCKIEDIEALRSKYNVKEGENLILFIGRLTWVKGVRNLIQAMPYVLNKHPNSKLVILGRGEEQKDIVELASRLNIVDKVYYRFEFVPETERILHYAASDLCVFPSIYEPFGIVSLEAMAMEKPIVVGARGVVGFREQVVPSGPEQNGIHINGNDPMDIAWGINEVLADKERARVWGINGRKRVLKYFTWDKVAEQTIKCYEPLLRK
ncbi:MAG: glycosyltransferase family 4 protein [Candidatus Bathyarchaeia archaeon]|nr:glycosyltransferase family 4 protein [Candidatus Bathyarchaeota archaeon]